MSTASELRCNTAQGKGPLAKAHQEEPVFLLRAQDNLAADLVEVWAIRARSLGAHDKAHEAQQIADQMRRWHIHKNPD